MSYGEAKEIALLRQQLRDCWNVSDRAGGQAILVQLSAWAGRDHELVAELRRWAARFA